MLALGATALSLFHTSHALADDDDESSVVLGLDGDLSIAPEGEEIEGGGGAALRLGLERELLWLLYVRPELGADIPGESLA